ncbi:16S rRNA methyltransferase [Serinibacter arcticus]|uniref:16S rRNA methyltransferase n=1 Tax=Serinibacter arcticus TaxID=1655435 RepID=A0A2U1ZST4_9MICO|nr:methyltransferase [Serinibacter arcticus]PWD50044.1 16S rRNA methyltransferase [Serinibacter arcticus]
MSHGEHYFTASPASPAQLRTIDVRLAGRDVRVTTAPGVFSGDHLDHATRLLLEKVPPPPATGDLLDLGCGWGPIALTLAHAAPQARVWAVDVNERALDLTRRNAEADGATNVTAVEPDEVPDDVTFAAIWSNPPIRIGKPAVHAMLVRWLPRLAPDGVAHLVVSKNLGADSLARWITAELGLPVERVTSAGGFRILRVTRA